MVSLDRQDLKESREQLVSRVRKVILALPDCLVHQVCLAALGALEIRVLLVLQALQGHRVPQEVREQQVQQDRRVQLVGLVSLDHRVQPVSQGLRDHRDQADHQEIQDSKALLDNQDL